MTNRLSHLALALACSLAAWADVSDLPVKVVGGKLYHYYEVQPKETIYSLERKLNITREELYRTNPSVRDGLKAFSVLLFPAEEGATATTADGSAAANVAKHSVTRGETIYGITKKYGITTDQFYKWNPSTRDGLKAGTTVFVSDPRSTASPMAASTVVANAPAAPLPAPAQAEAAPSGAVATSDYVVKSRETFFSIARDHGLTIRELEQLNPEIGVVREGDVIKVPAKDLAQSTESEPHPATPQTPVAPAAPGVSATAEPQTPEEHGIAPDSTLTEPAAPAITARNEVNIALMLPLMTGQPQSKHSALYTEYLKGFLIAVDSLRSTANPITVSVFDTHNSLDSVRAILSDGRVDGAKLIVAPDSEAHLQTIADFGRRNGVYVFNPFVVKDASFTTNPVMMQANIPQQQMYEKAIDGVITRFADWHPVFVGRADGPDDKEAFLKEIKERFTATGIEYSEVTFENRLSRSDINSLGNGKPLLFIPTSGRQAEASRIFPALIDFKDSGNTVRVFGYPEWTTFRGETLAGMHSLEALVYSRFFADPDESATKEIEQKFTYWYGTPMSNVLPRQGLLGFDTGMFIVKSMLDYGNDFTTAVMPDGVQNGYHFIVDGAGMFNDVLYFINYSGNETIERIRL